VDAKGLLQGNHSGKIAEFKLLKYNGVISMTKSLSHTKWMCKYHIIFTPKFRRKMIYSKYKENIVGILKDLCKWKGVEIIEGTAMEDHTHVLVSIPTKYSAGTGEVRSDDGQDQNKRGGRPL